MSMHPSCQDQTIEFPLLDHKTGERNISSTVSASSLLATSNAAKSPANPYKTLSAPIDRIIGPYMRPGYGLQISGPPGTYLEQLLIGLVKSVTSDGKEVMVVDMQNKLKASTICRSLDDDERADRVYYHMHHRIDEVIKLLSTFPDFLSTHPNVSLLILSSLSFPFQVESDFSARNTHLNHVRALIIKLCKHHGLVVVITSAMSMHFINPDGSRGTFDNDSTAVMTPQIDLSCKCISSLIISRVSRKSGRALFIPATCQSKLRVEFDYVGLDMRDKVA
ncbi:hypothetical protein JB92DRAFT_3002850 [Gautieria morchelliformis]|nr:hypothetical protein JB92DRAFT_3002850 [Gautieria morchelliformis]